MIDLLKESAIVEPISTGIKNLDEVELGAFGNLTIIGADFKTFRNSRTEYLLELLVASCENSECDGYILSPWDVSNQFDFSDLKQNYYLETFVDFNDVVEFIKNINKKAVVMVLSWEFFYHNCKLIHDTNANMEYCISKLDETVSQSKCATIVETQHEMIMAYRLVKFVRFNDKEHLIFDNEAIIELD